MKKYEMAEKYIPNSSAKKITAVGGTGTGKTTLFKGITGLNDSDSPLIEARGATTVSTQQIILTRELDVYEIFIKIKSKEYIHDLTEKNLENALKAYQQGKDKNGVYLKLGLDPEKQFPLMYSISEESELFDSIFENIKLIAQERDELHKNRLFSDTIHSIYNHLIQILSETIDRSKDLDIFASIGENRDDFIYAKAKNESDLFAFLKIFTGIDKKNRGKLLTPIVELIRFKFTAPKSLHGSLLKDNQMCCLTDTQGIGHNSQGISTELNYLINKSDYFFVVQSADKGGLDHALKCFIGDVANAGATQKLRIIFTHIDKVFEDVDKRVEENKGTQGRYDSMNEVTSHVAGFLEAGINDLVVSDISAYKGTLPAISEATSVQLHSHFTKHCYYVGKFDTKIDVDNSKFVESNLENLNKSLLEVPDSRFSLSKTKLNVDNDQYKEISMLMSDHPGNVGITTAPFPLYYFIELFCEEEINRYHSEHWSVIKALSRRYAQQTATNYRNLDPISSFIGFIKYQFRNYLERKSKYSLDEINSYSSFFSEKIFDFTLKKIYFEANVEWHQAYVAHGTGSSKGRLRIMSDLLESNLKSEKKKRSQVDDGETKNFLGLNHRHILSNPGVIFPTQKGIRA